VSDELEGAALFVGSGSGRIYPGADSLTAGSYPMLRPFPVATNTTKTVSFTAICADGTSNAVAIPFYMTTALTKPTASSTYKDITIFIYNATSAMAINRNTTAGCTLLFTKLSFTDYITKVPIAKFTVYNPGSATDIEKDLLLAGSALNKKQDNYVAIIIDKCVVWSGKILRSNQGKEGLFSGALVQSWEIDCEGDITRMQYQQVKTANKGERFLPIGQTITKLVENSSTVVPYTLVNWNGDVDIGLRSSEGLYLNYNISDADMFTQFISLTKNIDFDWRTHLTYLRYAYTSYSSSTWTLTLPTITPYTTSSFVGRWVLFTSTGSGVVAYGKVNWNSTTQMNIYMVNPTAPPATGTILILMDPVLDVVNDLSTPTKVQSFQINTQPSVSICNGYGFDDKTDRSLLATKIVAKAKSKEGITTTSAVAAVTPWNSSKCMFEDTTIITKRTEGVILETHIVESGASAGIYFTLEGWGYASCSYWAFVSYKRGYYQAPSTLTANVIAPLETYMGDKRVTRVCILYVPASGYVLIDIGDIAITTDCTYLNYTNPHGCYYIKSSTDLGYTSGMDIYIGGETITTVDCILDTVYGYKIRYIISGLANHRDKSSTYTIPHGPGAIVWRGGIYDEALSHPENDYSPCYYHGIISKTYMSDINISSSDLETYATLNLIKNSFYYRKGSFWCMLFDWFKTDKRTPYEQSSQSFIQVGDTISCLQNVVDTEDATLYGQFKNIWQVVSYTFDANTYKVTVELGDFERNMFTQLSDKTSSLHQTIT
jgi:hypothetical protein